MRTQHNRYGRSVGIAVAAAVSLLAPFAGDLSGQVVHTDPHGYIKLSVAPGTGATRRTTLLSIPLVEEASIVGAGRGRITGVTSNSITCGGAGWQVGQLSQAGTPHLIEITSGEAEGRMLLVSTSVPNTTDTLTIAPPELEGGGVDALGIAVGEQGDTYRIRPVDTLSSLLGTPESTLILGGATAGAADTVTMVVNGSAATYFFNTSSTPPRWSRVALGSPDASNVAIPPYAALQYSRLAPTPLEFYVTGKVPDGKRMVPLKNAGTTLLSTHWPVNQTLADLGLHEVAGWKKAQSARSADTVSLVSSGSVSTYFHDGATWRKLALGLPGADAAPVPAGAGVLVTRKGQGNGYSPQIDTAPYTLE
jgi:hypothetical protein